jgi:hypothetical protein
MATFPNCPRVSTSVRRRLSALGLQVVFGGPSASLSCSVPSVSVSAHMCRLPCRRPASVRSRPHSTQYRWHRLGLVPGVSPKRSAMRDTAPIAFERNEPGSRPAVSEDLVGVTGDGVKRSVADATGSHDTKSNAAPSTDSCRFTIMSPAEPG